jgi:hypothetical protein
MVRRCFLYLLFILASLLSVSSGRAQESRTAFVAPPRTIADVTALLDQEQPDPAKIAKLRADADAAIPPSLPPERLFAAYEQRALARAHLGRTREAISDFERAAAVGKGKIDPGVFARVRMALVNRYRQIGDYKTSFDHCLLLAREVDRPGSKGWFKPDLGTAFQSLGLTGKPI